MKIVQNVYVIFGFLLAVLMSTCSVKRKGQCYSCFDSLANVQQVYLDSSQATFNLDVTLNPESQFKIVLAKSRDLIDSVEKANIAATSDDVQIVSDWSPRVSLAFLQGLVPDQSYALALLEQNKFERIRIMEIKEFSTQSAASPMTGGVPKVLQVKKEEATIAFPSALDDTTKSAEMDYLVAVWNKDFGYPTKEQILEKASGISIVQDWTQATDQDIQEVRISGLSVETDYVIGIVARDSDGNTTLLPLRSLRTLDESAPDADAISLSSSSGSSVTITWPQAQDQETPADRLEYKVLLASSQSSLQDPTVMNSTDSNSLEPRVLQEWTPNLLQYEATGLATGRRYYFAVLVRDLGKNLASYRTQSAVLVDENAPAFKEDALEIFQMSTGYRYLDGKQVISYGDAGHKSSIAVDKATPSEEIEYLSACSSDAAALTSLETIEKNLGKVKRSSWQKAVRKKTSYSITVDRRDRDLEDYCNRSDYADYYEMGGPYRTATPELQNAQPQTFANICRVLQSYENGSTYEMLGVRTGCRYSGVAGELYGKVFARDADGMMTSLGPKLLAYAWDTDAPRFKADPTLSGDDTLSWTAATDYFTLPEKIEYKVVLATAAESIDTLEEVAAITTSAGGLVMDWTANVTSTQLNIALTGSSYTIALATSDELGNVRLAKAVSLQDNAPSVGTALTFSDFVFNSLIMSWGPALDDKTAAADLYYKLVRADASADIDTVAEANALSGSNVLLDWTKATTSYELTGSQLAVGALAVLVRDSVGQMALYEPVSRSQTVDGLQLYFDPGNTASYPGTGTTWKDLSGNAFDSTLYGGVAYLTSDGGVMDFDGVDDYVLLGDLSALKPTAAISISQWLAPDSWAPAGPGAYYIVSISCTQGSGYSINVLEAGSVRFQIYAGGTYRAPSTSTAGFTGWKHVTGTFDGRYAKLYVNGALASTVDAGATVAVSYIQNGILIGAEATSNNTPHTENWWAGKIGPTLIRSGAMTADEVLAEFNASKARFGL
ncbi:MAG TPA: LamG domain-containing protein [Oligoflexus sp.]|uniref:LamG domain-containing protein n=1 Tax=Oligoflexus sp. TaxID=1971216 RepID=UPI002D7FFF8D|nr:LamG domain-containing protein [Oligoflexus sp.]HET9241732.1 LamG domain-containing protein [Oligoflexus sp.]